MTGPSGADGRSSGIGAGGGGGGGGAGGSGAGATSGTASRTGSGAGGRGSGAAATGSGSAPGAGAGAGAGASAAISGAGAGGGGGGGGGGATSTTGTGAGSGSGTAKTRRGSLAGSGAACADGFVAGLAEAVPSARGLTEAVAPGRRERRRITVSLRRVSTKDSCRSRSMARRMRSASAKSMFDMWFATSIPSERILATMSLGASPTSLASSYTRTLAPDPPCPSPPESLRSNPLPIIVIYPP